MRLTAFIILYCALLFPGAAAHAAHGDNDGGPVNAFTGLSPRERADSLAAAGIRLAGDDPEQARKYAGTALDLANETGYRNGRAGAHHALAEITYGARDYGAAIEHAEAALGILDGGEGYDGTAELYCRYGHALNGAGRVDEAKAAFHHALRIHEAANDSLGIARINRALGLYFIRVTQYDSSLVYYMVARDYHRALGNPQRAAAMINSIAVSYYQLGLYDDALENYQESLDIRRSIGDREGVARVLTNIGMLYMDMGNLDGAETHLLEARGITLDINDAGMTGYTLNNVGALREAQGRDDEALSAYREALAVFREEQEVTNLTLTLNTVGALTAKQGDTAEALKLLEEAYATAERFTYRHGMAVTLNNMGLVYSATGDSRRARDAFGRSIRITRETGNRELLSETLSHIAALAESAGDYRESLGYFKEYVAIKDSLFGEETARNVDRLRIVHETRQKERENELLRGRQRNHEALLRRNNIIIVLISLLLVTATVFSAFLFALYAAKKRANAELSANNRKITEQRDEIELKNAELEAAVSRIHTLSGLLPICASCKKIRDDDGYWDEVEGYISKHSGAVFTHSICPDCMKKLYPDIGGHRTRDT